MSTYIPTPEGNPDRSGDSWPKHKHRARKRRRNRARTARRAK